MRSCLWCFEQVASCSELGAALGGHMKSCGGCLDWKCSQTSEPPSLAIAQAGNYARMMPKAESAAVSTNTPTTWVAAGALSL